MPPRNPQPGKRRRRCAPRAGHATGDDEEEGSKPELGEAMSSLSEAKDQEPAEGRVPSGGTPADHLLPTAFCLLPSAPDAPYEARARAGENVHGEADFVESFHPGSVLDAGCGTGRVAIELARRGIEVVGVDLDPGMLAT